MVLLENTWVEKFVSHVVMLVFVANRTTNKKLHIQQQMTSPINPLKTTRKLFNLKTQFVPRNKRFSTRL